MQDIQCPAPADATEVEQMACETPTKPLKPKDGEVKPLGGGGGTTNPTDPKPPKPSGD